MAPGTLSVGNQSTPLFAPSYPTDVNSFTGVNILEIQYRTAIDDVKHLIPDIFELEDEPLVIASLITYNMSTVGAYNECIHQVEVTYKGTKYDYFISLILDNEAAIFSGREQFGYPKTFGKVTMESRSGMAALIGKVEKPVGVPLIEFAFTPGQKLDQSPQSASKSSLNYRLIPSPVPNSPPSVKELVPVLLQVEGGEVWQGKGSVSYPSTLDHHPIHRLRVLRYETSTYIIGTSAHLPAPQKVITL